MYTPDRLMAEARERLDVEVSDESISEAEGLAREAEDFASSEAESGLTFGELVDTSPSLTDREKFAIGAVLEQERGIGSVAEDLGISRAAASRILDHAMDKLANDIVEREPPHGWWSLPDWHNVRRFVGRRNAPLRGATTLIDSLSVTVQGDEDSIVDFNRTLLNRFPDIETIGRGPAENATGDATLQLRFRPPMPVEHARRALEETARETGVILSLRTYSKSSRGQETST
jgi:hypothetical protein